MATLRYNNIFGTASVGNITLTNTGGAGDNTATFSAAPNFPTIGAADIVKIIVEPDTPAEEIIYLSPYTAGALTGTVARGLEGTTKVAHTNVGWVHGPTASDIGGGGGGSITAFSVINDTTTAVTDNAATYDLPNMSIAGVTAGTYAFGMSLVSTTSKSGQIRCRLTDGANTVLWPLGASLNESVTNADNFIQFSATGLIVVSSTITVKARAEAAGAVGNYSLGTRSLYLIKIA